ncbi:hypothetical protein VCHA53O466_140113 [Vibrio chagasii]|nr:hypothetical protein VCHA53O466_140113 [Vibrio chagasii]
MCNIHIIDADSYGNDDLHKFASSKLANNEKVFVCSNKRLNSVSDLESKYPALFYFLHAPTMKNGADVYILLELREFIGRTPVSNMHLYSAPDKEQITNMKVAAHYFGANFHWQQSNPSKKESRTRVIEEKFNCTVIPKESTQEIDCDDRFVISSKLEDNKKLTHFTQCNSKPSKAGRSLIKLMRSDKAMKFNHIVQSYYREHPNKLNEFVNYKNSAKAILSNLVEQGWIIRLRDKPLDISLPNEPRKSTSRTPNNSASRTHAFTLSSADKAKTHREQTVAGILLKYEHPLCFDELLNQYMSVSQADFSSKSSYKLSLSAVIGNLIKKGALVKSDVQQKRPVH